MGSAASCQLGFQLRRLKTEIKLKPKRAPVPVATIAGTGLAFNASQPPRRYKAAIVKSRPMNSDRPGNDFRTFSSLHTMHGPNP